MNYAEASVTRCFRIGRKEVLFKTDAEASVTRCFRIGWKEVLFRTDAEASGYRRLVISKRFVACSPKNPSNQTF